MQFSNAESVDLFKYMVHTRNKYENAHTRKTRSKNKVKFLESLNAVYFNPTGNYLEGYVCGPNVEIQYEIHMGAGYVAQTRILWDKNANPAQALKYLEKWVRPELLKRVKQGFGAKFPVKRKKGEFYLQRWNKPRLTRGARAAVKAGILSQTFVDTIRRWDLRVLYPK